MKSDTSFHCKTSDIFVDPELNSRKNVTPGSCDTLAKTIEEVGQLQAVIVRKATKADNVKQKYVLVAGFRRFMAISTILNRDTIEATLVKSGLSKQINIIENLERKPITRLEQAHAIAKLHQKYTQPEIASMFGRSVEWVSRFIRLLDMPREMQLMVNSGKLSLAEAIKLRRHKEKPEVMISEAKKLIERHKKSIQAYSENGKRTKRKRSRIKALLEHLTKHERMKEYKQVIATALWLSSEMDTESYFEVLGIKDEAEDFLLICP